MKFGASSVSKLYFGAAEGTKAYLGGTLVMDNSGPPPVGQTFDVTTYGAVGDGLTDDTIAIRDTITAAEAWAAANSPGIATVYYPTGTYAVSPQPTDTQWVNRTSYDYQPWTFGLTQSNVHHLGDGSGLSVISVYTISSDGTTTLADPETNWMDISAEPLAISQGYRIMRGGGYALRAAVSNIEWKDLRITLNAMATGDHTVGGNVTTGDGWDVSHKAIFLSAFGSSDIRITNCILDRCRGEIVHGGGDLLMTCTITNSTLEYANSSATSMPAMVMEDSTVRWTFNGVENYSRTAGQGTAVRRCTIQSNSTYSPSDQSNGVVYIGSTACSAVIEDNTITGFPSGAAIFLAEGGDNVTISGNTISDVNLGVKFLSNGLYSGDPASWKHHRNVTISGGSISVAGSDQGGVFLGHLNSSGAIEYDNFTISGVAFSGTAFRLENKAGVGTFPGSVVRNCVFNGSLVSLAGPSPGSARMVWENNNTYNSTQVENYWSSGNSSATTVQIRPWSGNYGVWNLNADIPVYIDATDITTFQDGDVLILQVLPRAGSGSQQFTLLASDPYWNLGSDLTVTSASPVALQFDAANTRFDVIP